MGLNICGKSSGGSCNFASELPKLEDFSEI